MLIDDKKLGEMANTDFLTNHSASYKIAHIKASSCWQTRAEVSAFTSHFQPVQRHPHLILRPLRLVWCRALR